MCRYDTVVIVVITFNETVRPFFVKGRASVVDDINKYASLSHIRLCLMFICIQILGISLKEERSALYRACRANVIFLLYKCR